MPTRHQTTAELYTDALTAKAKELGRRLKLAEYQDVLVDLLNKRYTAMGIPKLKSGEFSDEVENIYAPYPRKAAPKKDKIAIMKALQTNEYEYLLERTRTYGAHVKRWPEEKRWKPDGTDICPHASTWFNEERFDADESEWAYKGKIKTKAPTPFEVEETAPEGWTEALVSKFGHNGWVNCGDHVERNGEKRYWRDIPEYLRREIA